MSIIAEFTNALFLLKNKGEILLYQGPLPSGGIAKVSITSRSGEGYSQNFYDLKQVVAIPGKQAAIMKTGLPSKEFTYQLIYDTIKEKYNGLSNLSEKNTEGTETLTDFDPSNLTDPEQPPHHAQLEHIEKVYTTGETDPEGNFGEDDFFGEIRPEGSNETTDTSNTVTVTSVDGSKSAQVRDSVFKFLES